MDDFETDEDRMIYQLELHRDIITWICTKLTEFGIPFERTRGNSAKGDILLISASDSDRVKFLVREWNMSFNHQNERP